MSTTIKMVKEKTGFVFNMLKEKESLFGELSSFDPLSMDILILLFIREKMRFNELLKVLKGSNRKFSKPTLVKHLKSLADKNIIIREEEGVQKVTYRINERKYMITKEIKEEYNKTMQYFAKIHQPEKERTPFEDINWYIINAIIAYIQQLKIKIQVGLPPINLPYDENYSIKSVFTMPYEDFLLNNCIADEDYKKKTLEKIDEILQYLMVKSNE